MWRNPPGWEVQIRREVLDDEITRLREVPYSFWKDVLRRPISKIVTARDDKPYLLRLTTEMAADGSEDIHITLSLAGGRLIRRRLLHQTFTITRENTFRA